MGDALSSRDAERVRQLRSELAIIDADRSDLSRFTAQLRIVLAAKATCIYSVSPAIGGGYALDRWNISGADSVTTSVMDAFFAEAPQRFGYYDPIHPQPSQQNIVRTASQLRAMTRRPSTPIEERVLSRFGLDQTEQRTLVCNRGQMLAWVGGWKERFSRRDRIILAALTEALRKRLLVQRAIEESSGVNALLDTALEAIPRPAFVSTRSGAVLVVNQLGRDALDGSTSCMREMLASACRGEDSRMIAQRIHAPGLAPLWLVLGPAPTRACAAVALMAGRAKLSHRQREVLELLARGYSNKGIAAELGCAPKTVEVHVTALLERCGVGSRGELMGKLLKLAST